MPADIDECALHNNASVVFMSDVLADIYLRTLHKQYFVFTSKV